MKQGLPGREGALPRRESASLPRAKDRRIAGPCQNKSRQTARGVLIRQTRQGESAAHDLFHGWGLQEL